MYNEDCAKYRAAVVSYAKEIFNNERDGSETRDRSDVVWEVADNSEWVIYTAKNLEVIRWTSNDDAFAEYGNIGTLVTDNDSSASIYQCIAFYAFMADINEELADLDANSAVDDTEAVPA